MKKKGENNNLIAWVLIGLVAVAVFGGADKIMSAFTGEEAPADGAVISCDLDNVALTVGSNRLGKAGTEPGEGFRMFIKDSAGNWLDKSTKAEDSSTDVSVNSEFKIYSGENSTTYYTKKVTGNVDCSNPYEVFTSLAFASTSVDAYITNYDGTLNSASAMALTTSQKKTEKVTMNTAVDEFYGNPDANCKNIVVFVYNKTQYDEVKIQGATKVSVPLVHSAGIDTVNQSVAYEIAPLAGGIERVYSVDITVSDDGNPGATQDIWMYEYDCDYDLNADDLSEIIGVEDESNNDLGTATTELNVIDIS